MISRKIIKKLAQISVILLLSVIAVPASAYLLLQSNRVQNNLAARVMNAVSQKFNTRFTIGDIDIAFLYRVRIHDVYLEDVAGDTLIYAGTVTAGIRTVNPLTKKISIGSINVDKGTLNLAIDSVRGLNLKYFLDKLRGSNQGGGGKWTVEFNNMRLTNSNFRLKNKPVENREYGMDYTNLWAYDINADIRRFNPSRDSLSFVIRSLSLKEKSGFTLNKLSSKFSESNNFLTFRDLQLETPLSDINGDEISLRFDSFSKFKGDSFANSVNMRLYLQDTRFDLSDLSYFVPSFRDIRQKVNVSGRVSGKLNNLKGKNLNIGFGNYSKFSGDLQFEGLPDISQTFIVADINEFTTSSDDLGNLQYLRQKGINIPEVLNKLGNITYKGNFTGFINDFVAYGQFNTALGIINTDILFRPDSSNMLSFQGKLNAQGFNIGKLADASDKMGNISLTATIDGATVQGKTIKATLKGTVGQFELMKYEYTNISLSGDLDNKTFNGSVNVRDPHIDLEFLGKVDFSDSIPSFDFTANVTDADLYSLNISRADPDFRASFYLIAKARGKSINSMNGEVKLLNSLFVKKNKQLQIYDLNLISSNASGENILQIKSDFLDAELSGNYELNKAGDIMKSVISEYLPSLTDGGSYSIRDDQHLELNARVKYILPLFEFFMPDYAIAENSQVNATYNAGDHTMEVHFASDFIKAKSIRWNHINLNATGNDDFLELEAGSESLMFGNRIKMENFSASANTANDTAGMHFRWNNWQDVQNKGLISAVARISRPQGSRNPVIELNLKPSDVITRDTLWAIQPGIITIDSSAIKFDNVAINHRNEYFRIDGGITEDPSDVVNVSFNHFDLANLNSFSATSGYNLGGVLNGNAKLSGIHSTPLFTSLLKIDSLVINNEMLGSTEINSSWDNHRKAVILNVTAMRDNLRTVMVSGEYIPSEDGKMAFDVELEKLRLNLFNPYVRTIFSDLRGIASGKATVSGTLKKPLLNGQITLQKTALTVNYLKTRYSFSDKVDIENNNIYFDNVRLFDTKGNSAYLSGAIRNRYLKDFVLDLNLRAENFFSLNTTLADNKQFYGTAYATGNVKIQGPPKNITMDITATTNKNTSVKIPLSNTGELNEYPFIQVSDINEGTTQETEDRTYRADLSGIQVRFRLTVTPDAEVQIIIDPKLGEIIKGRGTGDLDIRINSRGDFLMNGDYVIEQGDYLFTLQKVINKKLTIEPGGTIRWDGDPLNANIDLIANYSTRASIADLIPAADDQKILVNDCVTLTGKLMSPEIKYDVYLPDADEATRLRVAGAMSTTEEKSRQFISILMTRRFALSQSLTGQEVASTSYSSAAGSNFSELLSNQLSNWLSQIVNDLDVDVNYRSNREMNSDEVELALSYQLFNDKLTIYGSVDYGTRASNATKSASSELVGEFDIDYKLTDNGKLRLKTFNHANNEILEIQSSAYTQGLGITYKEEFNTLGELIRRLFGKKEESPQPVEGDDDNAPPVVNNLP